MSKAQDIMDMPVPGAPITDKTGIMDIITKVTQHNLDDVLERHTSLYDHYTFEIPHIRHYLALFKREIERSKQSLFLDIKDKNSVAYESAEQEYGKLTEKMIEAIITTDEELCAMEDRMGEWQRALNERERLRDVFLAREASARATIQLYISGYWGPSTRGQDSPRVNGTEPEADTSKTERDSLADMGRGTRDPRRKDYDPRQEDRQGGGRRFRRRGA